jgi:hypothetical protein
VIAQLAVRLGATPTPSPSPSLPDASTVTPGLIGFLATFALAVATVLLVLDMVRRVRRLRYREQQELARQQRERDAATHEDGPAVP